MAVELSEEERKARQEHRDAVLDLRALLATAAGIRFFKYLFRSLDVAQLPARGLPPEILHEYLGLLRAGNEIFKLASEANLDVTAKLLAELEKERYEYLLAEAQIGQS